FDRREVLGGIVRTGPSLVRRLDISQVGLSVIAPQAVLLEFEDALELARPFGRFDLRDLPGFTAVWGSPPPVPLRSGPNSAVQPISALMRRRIGRRARSGGACYRRG